MPRITRPGARSSKVENVDASSAGLRVQLFTTPEPTLIRSVTARNAAIGTVASRTSRLSACQMAWKPSGLCVTGDLHALPDGVRVLQIDGDLRAHGDTSVSVGRAPSAPAAPASAMS